MKEGRPTQENQEGEIVPGVLVVFEQINNELDNPWSHFDTLTSEEIEDFNLDRREKYEAIKKLQEGDPSLLLNKLDIDIAELRATVERLRTYYAGREEDMLRSTKQDLDRYVQQMGVLAELRRSISNSFSLKQYRERGSKTEEKRRSMVLEARRIFISYHFDEDGNSEYVYQALREMQDGHPEKVLERLKAAIDFCRTVASQNLQPGAEGEPPDIEESYARQAEFMAMEAFMRAIQVEYGMPIEMTPALKRMMRGERESKTRKKKARRL